MDSVDLIAVKFDCIRSRVVAAVSRRLQAGSPLLDAAQAWNLGEHRNFPFPTKASSAGARLLAEDPLTVVLAIAETAVVVLAIAVAAD